MVGLVFVGWWLVGKWDLEVDLDSPADHPDFLDHEAHQPPAAGVRRRFAPHQLRHAHAVEMSREGISLIVIQRQLGHADLAITSRYMRGIDNTEIIQAVHQRPEPMIPAGRELLAGR